MAEKYKRCPEGFVEKRLAILHRKQAGVLVAKISGRLEANNCYYLPDKDSSSTCFSEVFKICYQKESGLDECAVNLIINLWQVDNLADRIASKMIKNSQAVVLKPEILGDDQPRPKSVYYHCFKDGTVMVQEGQVNDSGEGALHDHLRKSEIYKLCEESDLVQIWSGHTWELPELGLAIALFDAPVNLSECKWKGWKEVIDAMTSNGYVCVGAKGEPLYERAVV